MLTTSGDWRGDNASFSEIIVRLVRRAHNHRRLMEILRMITFSENPERTAAIETEFFQMVMVVNRDFNIE